jgi:hypothetical protein
MIEIAIAFSSDMILFVLFSRPYARWFVCFLVFRVIDFVLEQIATIELAFEDL